MGKPTLRCWTQESVLPRTYYDFKPGRRVAKSEYADFWVQWQKPRLAKFGPSPVHGIDSPLTLCSPHSVGYSAEPWRSHGIDSDLPADQRMEAGGCMNIDTGPLAENLEILGAPVISLKHSRFKPA
ncbi:MAG: hypothetical protein OXI87_06475 [Albidovulum sp.]|nr:hypothetical protein [Albidovulum sp.]MDE0304517.1 hypothetical protein [Albidovulum sp.]